MSFESAAVIGTGMMGPGIAAILAIGGLRTTLISRSAESGASGLEAALRAVALLEEHGLATPEASAQARERLGSAVGLDPAVRDVDLVIESAPEDMAFKQQLFSELDALTRPGAVLASNTSGLSITSIAERCTRPERVLTTHFWNPPHLMPLVEVVLGERTDPRIAEEIRLLLSRCGKIAVKIQKDKPGQLGNRLQFALLREAIHIVQEGIATAEDVDLAAKNGFGLRLPVYGIFEHQDAVGLDLSIRIADYVMRDLYSEPHPPGYLGDLVSRGDLGAKTGKGFYDWSTKDINQVKATRDQFVLEFMKSRVRKA